ncbi:hypothetical protein PUN28_009925 [Cardiocondyla obscurior]|uniref:Uncharacterized protein n=1 Tax=Cardiocondyla obscurior TaxID=286306 RepID=A0AAW2FR63_9HYME
MSAKVILLVPAYGRAFSDAVGSVSPGTDCRRGELAYGAEEESKESINQNSDSGPRATSGGLPDPRRSGAGCTATFCPRPSTSGQARPGQARPGRTRFEMYVYRVLTAANVCGEQGGRVSQDRVSEDGLTDVRAYAQVNEVSGTYP